MATDVVATARKVVNAPLGALDQLGDQMSFYTRAVAWTPRTLRHYKKETLRLLSEVVFGSGALAIIGGTVGVIAFLSPAIELAWTFVTQPSTPLAILACALLAIYYERRSEGKEQHARAS